MEGGKLVDFIYQKYQMASIWLKDVLDLILQHLYQVLINQVVAWLLYGQIIDKNQQFFVHRVTFQPSCKFKFNNKNITQVDITDWQMFTIQTSRIPISFIKHSTAGKILFIGKSTKILKNCQKISILPTSQSLTQIKNMQKSSYKSSQLQQIIQRLRQKVAHKMINLIMQQQNFLKQLQKVNEYYLMICGHFYQLLLQQSKSIDKISNKQKAKQKLNQQYLPNTFMRLNSEEDSKKVSFQFKSLGFHFHGFKNFCQLCPVGNINLIDGKSIRFNGNGGDGALWHKTKQLLENDFHIVVIFQFKKCLKFFKNQPKFDTNKNVSKAVISVVLQNCQQVLQNSHTNPQNLRLLEQYLSVDIGFVSNEKQTQFASFINISAYSRKYSKQMTLANKKIQKINLMDQNQYQLKISYSQRTKNNLKVSLGIPNSTFNFEHNQLNIDLSLPYYVNLEMGRGYVGLISNFIGSSYCVQINQWQMICTSPNHYGDHWSDLCLHYKISWPLDLVLTHDLLDNFSRVHKFLFPMRQVQIDLQHIWKIIPTVIKQQSSTSKTTKVSKTQKNQLTIFQRRISAFRSQLCLVISQLWKYFQSDVIQTAWCKLKSCLTTTEDFQNLIQMVNMYIKSIQTMFYFNIPKIQKNINDLIRHSKQFINFFKKLQLQKIDETSFTKFQSLKDSFDDILKNFVHTLKQLSNVNSSDYLFHLSQRMISCCYQDKYQHKNY